MKIKLPEATWRQAYPKNSKEMRNVEILMKIERALFYIHKALEKSRDKQEQIIKEIKGDK